jgi:hypothetical protein
MDSDGMRTTIDLPDDLLRRAREEAAQRGLDVNEFIAAAIAKEVPVPSTLISSPRSKLPTIKARGSATIPNISSELQARLDEEEDLASYHRSAGR